MKTLLPQAEQYALENSLGVMRWEDVHAILVNRGVEKASVEACRRAGRIAEYKLRQLLAADMLEFDRGNSG